MILSDLIVYSIQAEIFNTDNGDVFTFFFFKQKSTFVWIELCFCGSLFVLSWHFQVGIVPKENIETGIECSQTNDSIPLFIDMDEIREDFYFFPLCSPPLQSFHTKTSKIGNTYCPSNVIGGLTGHIRNAFVLLTLAIHN